MFEVNLEEKIDATLKAILFYRYLNGFRNFI
jgi:hypothetical protein